MKAVKIILAVLAVLILGFVIFKTVGGIEGPDNSIDGPKNQFTERLEAEIDSLQQMSYVTSNDYKTIKYHIEDYYSNNRLGKDSDDARGNENNYNSYTRLLYSSYLDKFVAQAFGSFQKSSWPSTRIQGIYAEAKNLLNEGDATGMLDHSSEIYGKLKKIQQVSLDYFSVTKFISGCSGFGSSATSMSARYPTSEAAEKVSTASNYLSGKLGGTYSIGNIEELASGLRKVPQNLFSAHVSYLRNKIEANGGSYRTMEYSQYTRTVTNALLEELNELSSSTYGAAYNSSYSQQLKNLINKYSTDGYEYLMN